MRKALCLSEMTAMLSRVRSPTHRLVDYLLIGGSVAAAAVTLIALVTQGTLSAVLGRIADSLVAG
jgi:hypothetical protein